MTEVYDKQESSSPHDSDSGINAEEMRSIARTLTHETSFTNFEGDPNPLKSDDPELDPNNDAFNAEKWARRMYYTFRSDEERYPDTSLGVSFKDLECYGEAQDLNYQLTVANAPLAFLELCKSLVFKSNENRFDILKPMDGIVKPGELLMVLGRPGAGCSTFLRTMASQTHGFKVSKDSVINYQGITPKEVGNEFRSTVTYCAETELHFPKLTVGQTLMFASRLKVPENRIPGLSKLEYAKYMRDIVMAQFGLSHTVNTPVGNDMIRGVSGGERKRVSIAELSLAGASIQCWDNSTRGLDSATANEFIKTLRNSARTFGSTPLVAVYQASEEMYDMFDRVVVFYEGYQIYFGPIGVARQFFMDMGWEPKPRQSTPDFLTSLSQPSERVAYKGREKEVPRTAKEFNERWRASELYASLRKEIDEYNQQNPCGGDTGQRFRQGYRATQDPKLPKKSAYTSGWWEQTKALSIRGFQRIQGDPQMPLTTILGNAAMAFIISSMFYSQIHVNPAYTSSFYGRSALLFFALLFNAFSAMLEIFSLFESRDIVQKHHQYAFYHPALDALASIITEMPVKIVNALFFNIILYFMSHLRREAGNFFFFLFMNFLSTLMMSHFFRSIGAITNSISVAMIPATMILLAMVLFTGFVIPQHKLKHAWTAAGPYIDPLIYAFESLMTNEFHDRNFICGSLLKGKYTPSYIPYPPDQAQDNRFICSAQGAKQGLTYVNGDDYLENVYEFRFSHQWRNIGIEIGFVFFFLGIYMLFVYLNPGARTKGEVLVFPRSIVKKIVKNRKRKDPEENAADNQNAIALGAVDADELNHNQEERAKQLIEASDEIFYWKDVCYDIKIKKEPRRLLNYVDGWVKPGTLTALMGASGAGKTTLLDTLANRVTMGVVTGQIFVNSIPRDNSFQRTTGYAMQQDLHLETSTVREALVFSALLRQPASVPRAEKLAYVNNVLEILEMESYADAVVGVPGKGLNVEQRKRLTIGVELAAKPKLLLFLDEPTSGLDSQTAWSICQLLKKLSNAGQAILCTIHQPSALLLSQFDRLLFLARGGRTVYFGEIGDNCNTLTSYFEKYGADPCPPDANPAEWMLSVIGAAPGSHAKYDYASVWLHSSERKAVHAELERLIKEFDAKDSNKSPDTENNGEFAAPFWKQYLLATQRNIQQQWRSPLYIWAKIGLSVFCALLNGFVFWKAPMNVQGLQDLMFSVFMFTVISNSIINAFVDVFAVQRNMFETRERPSKIFSWIAFLLGSMTSELPWQILTAVLSFVCWYYPAGLYQVAKYSHQMSHRAGLTLFYVILFYQWVISLGFALGAPMEDPRTAANVSVLLFTVSLMFAGVLVTKDVMPGFWKFMYRVSPMQKWILGMLTLAVANHPIECAENEWLLLSPPSGTTCGQYFNAFIQQASKSGSVGYLKDPSATDMCRYCASSETNQYLASINAPYSQRWVQFGYFWIYIAFNYLAAIVLYWIARVPKSSSRTKPVDYQGRDVALEEDNTDLSTLPPAIQQEKN